jgi:hypothetical protein
MGVTDILTGQKLMEIVALEVRRLAEAQAAGPLNGGQVQNLERIVKTFHVLKCEDREAQKALGGLTENELLELAGEELDGSADTTE